MPRLAIAVAALPLLLAACSDGAGTDGFDVSDEAVEQAPEQTGIAVDNIANEKVAGIDDPVPALEPLGDELDVDLGPTLGGCYFRYRGDVLFIAGAPDEARARGNGAIQVAGRDRLLAGAEMGGPDMINAGPTMTDGEYTVTIERAEGEGVPIGIERTQWNADLVVRKDAANAVRYSPGTWTCGV